MDDIVRQALLKWPHVPHCYGWLGLDMRGQWWLRDAVAQAAGPFAVDPGEASLAEGWRSGQPSPSKGTRLEHAQLLGFIQRNYAVDEAGQWFFQNGPQRVYVELECAPVVWRIWPDGSVHAHTGQAVGPMAGFMAGKPANLDAAGVQACLLDERGHLYLVRAGVLGVVHTQDMLLAAQAVEVGHWVPQEVRWAELPRQWGFVRSPAARQGQAAQQR